MRLSKYTEEGGEGGGESRMVQLTTRFRLLYRGRALSHTKSIHSSNVQNVSITCSLPNLSTPPARTSSPVSSPFTMPRIKGAHMIVIRRRLFPWHALDAQNEWIRILIENTVVLTGSHDEGACVNGKQGDNVHSHICNGSSRRSADRLHRK